jgi:hypothetical protein
MDRFLIGLLVPLIASSSIIFLEVKLLLLLLLFIQHPDDQPWFATFLGFFYNNYIITYYSAGKYTKVKVNYLSRCTCV